MSIAGLSQYTPQKKKIVKRQNDKKLALPRSYTPVGNNTPEENSLRVGAPKRLIKIQPRSPNLGASGPQYLHRKENTRAVGFGAARTSIHTEVATNQGQPLSLVIIFFPSSSSFFFFLLLFSSLFFSFFLFLFSFSSLFFFHLFF